MVSRTPYRDRPAGRGLPDHPDWSDHGSQRQTREAEDLQAPIAGIRDPQVAAPRNRYSVRIVHLTWITTNTTGTGERFEGPGARIEPAHKASGRVKQIDEVVGADRDCRRRCQPAEVASPQQCRRSGQRTELKHWRIAG
jgi:hypothetical protein